MVRAVIFDCFGVIITDALQVVVSELQAKEPETARQIVDIIHANNRGLIEPVESNQRIAELLGVSVAAWRERVESGEIKDARLLAYIRELRERGYKTALLSNIGRQSLHRRFNNEELHETFDAIIVSAELGIMKPEPEIYQYAARELGVPAEECLMVDDRERHCKGAEDIGMQSLLYQNFEQGKRAIEHALAL